MKKGLEAVGQAVPERVVPHRFPLEWVGGSTLGFHKHVADAQTLQTRNCAVDESGCLPQGVLSFAPRRSLPSSALKAAAFSLLAIRPQRFLSDSNRSQRVCQFREKLTSVSDCSYYSHLGLLDQLCSRSKRDCDVFSLPVEVVSQHRALWTGSHSGGRSAFVLGCALLRCGNDLQTAPVF